MRRLAVFARSPVPGRVKSRLSPALPARCAAALYAGLLADTFRVAAGARADERWASWADEPGPAPGGILARTQRGEDLGERLRNTFEDLLRNETDRALVVGSDTPALEAADLDRAFAALETHDVVVGPTLDGGYWCIGLGRSAPELFRDIPWSTRDVLTRTLVRAHGAGLRVATVSMLADLDTPHDLALLLGAIAAGEPACGPSARAALHALGMLPAART
jgi:rSAM/selenodomain-associated transferase 1